MPPRKRSEAANIGNSSDARADVGTRSPAATFGVRLRYRMPAPNQRMFSTRITVKTVAMFKGYSRRRPELKFDG
jgi:hypothetical protein